MLRFFLASLLMTGLLAACTPRTTAVANVTVTPLLIKASETPVRGGNLTIQGRFLGGPTTGRVLIGANEDGADGIAIPASAVQTWTDTEIVVQIPQGVPAGGSWLFVEVGGRLSTGLRVSVR